MKKITLLVFTIFLFSEQVFAVKLSEALLQAYNENPILNAERQNLDISKENINISKSQFLPTMTITGTKSKENTNKLTNQSGVSQSINDVNPLVKTFLIEQTLFDGKERSNDLKKNKLGLDLARIKIFKVEQETLFKAIEAYTGLTVSNKKLLINKKNLNLLSRQVENDKARLERGGITIADLAQSESSLAGAQAKLIEAQNNVMSGKLMYENIIGNVKLNTFKENIDIFPIIPKSLSEANNISIKNSPNLIIARLEYEQSQKDTKISQSVLFPSATLSFEANQSEDLSSTYDEKEKNTFKATVKWPFYTGGKNRSTNNKNKNINKQKKLLMFGKKKKNKTDVASAWSNLQYSKSFLNSIKFQVKAA